MYKRTKTTTMNKLIALIAIILLASCSATTYQMKTTTVDFENYNRDGFLITTSSVGSNYQSLGLVDVACQCGFVPRQAKPEKKNIKEDDVYGTSVTSHTSEYFYCTKADLIDAIYIHAKELKANAIIDLRFSEYTTKTETGLKVIFTATGLAVRLKFKE